MSYGQMSNIKNQNQREDREKFWVQLTDSGSKGYKGYSLDKEDQTGVQTKENIKSYFNQNNRDYSELYDNWTKQKEYLTQIADQRKITYHQKGHTTGIYRTYIYI